MESLNNMIQAYFNFYFLPGVKKFYSDLGLYRQLVVGSKIRFHGLGPIFIVFRHYSILFSGFCRHLKLFMVGMIKNLHTRQLIKLIRLN